MTRIFTTIFCGMFLMGSFAAVSSAQEYSSPQVVVSSDKVRQDGKIFYSHVVQERQTLYSICKAYNVTQQEIFSANPKLNLESEGLKKDQIILIPVKEDVPAVPAADETKKMDEPESVTKEETVTEDDGKINEYSFYRVKWFDDLDAIAAKFKVSKKSIMNMNGLTSEKLKRRQMLKIPKYPEQWENVEIEVDKTESPDVPAEETEAEERPDSTEENKEESWKGIFDGLFNKEGGHKVGLSLLLPINTKGKANESILDFYSGALMAAKKLGESGIDLDMDVYDVASGAVPQSSEVYSDNSFTIGPVSSSDILKAVRASRGYGWIVSPLEPKAEALADTTANLIQAPAPASSQVRDMVDWIKSDTKDGDKVILITQKGVAATTYATSVINTLKASGLSYSTLSFSVLEGRDIIGKLTAMMSQHGTTRVMMASDSEAFALEVVRNLYMLTNKELSLAMYSTSRIRSFDTIDLEQLHAINLHVSLSYYVDYNSPEVKDFVMQYRALFNAEPTQFAFQGYDLTHYFSTLYSKFGSNWESGLGTFSHTGLQADFDLKKSRNGGYINNSVRRIIYKPDYSIEKVR